MSLDDLEDYCKKEIDERSKTIHDFDRSDRPAIREEIRKFRITLQIIDYFKCSRSQNETKAT